MGRWADFCVSRVRYRKDKTIDLLEVRSDTSSSLGDPKEMVREAAILLMEEGTRFVTVTRTGKDNWEKGSTIRIINVGGRKFLRIDRNPADSDNIGSLPEF